MKFAIREVLSDKVEGRYVGVEKPFIYSSFDDNEYKKYYQELVEGGYLKDIDYNSDYMVFIDENGKTSTVNINIISFRKEIKRYGIIMLRFSTSIPSTIARELRAIIWALKETDFLSDEGFDNLQIKINEYSSHQIRKLRYLERFIDFVGEEKYSNYIEILEKLDSNETARLIRDIPDYESLLRYDFYIEDFYKKDLLNYKKKYFPIILWWKLSSIIPMRPVEIAELPYNCISESDGKYYITITRYKDTRSIVDDSRTNKNIKKNYSENRRKQVLRITEEIYKLFKEYNHLIKKPKRNYFFDLVFHRNNRRSSLAYLLKEFNDEIIKGYYKCKTINVKQKKNNKIEIKLPRLGDTRHVAFCGMMLQGFNPLTIMEIGGHTTIDSQLHYTSHMETFAESSINQLSESMTNLILSGDSIIKTHGIGRKNIAKLANLGDSFYDLPKVNGGRCTSGNIPEDCPPTECIFCEKYFVYDDDKEFLKILMNEKDREIKSKLDYIKHLYENAKQSKSPDLNRSEELKNNANNLRTLVKQKAVLKTYEKI